MDVAFGAVPGLYRDATGGGAAAAELVCGRRFVVPVLSPPGQLLSRDESALAALEAGDRAAARDANGELPPAPGGSEVCRVGWLLAFFSFAMVLELLAEHISVRKSRLRSLLGEFGSNPALRFVSTSAL